MRTTLPIGGGFAGGLAASITPALKDLAKSKANQTQAMAEGALLGAKTYSAEQQANLANVKAADVARALGLRDNQDYLAQLDAIQPGAGTIFKGGASADNLANTMLTLQKAGLFQEAANAIPESSTGLDRQNRFTAVASGGTYTPFKAVGDSGYAIDQGTGKIVRANPGMAALFGDQQTSQAALRKAQADQQRFKYDANRGAIVDMAQGTAQPVHTSSGQPLPYQDKPMPTAALKMQQENLDAIGTAASINADLGSFASQIENGSLDLGFFTNLMSKALNNMGLSTEESRNLQSFQSTLEKLRNDSLRLNKGVQTDGDAQRAWNELLANINDPLVVQQRLEEIQAINARAVELRSMMNDAMRANYGLQPMSYEQYTNQPSVINSGVRVDQQEDPRISELRRRAATNPALAQRLRELGY
ncbi:hypothetical protein [Neopusillimonas maritima]|uniref:Uncharacterized protein n=2 Tax=Neopusillimonas maritima TaxID=2026239 RepID=A0ABX9N0K7_9BURK|nr:hypothetical protein [Neopusillimonas maritima]RII84353.1 hypothetical protein CJO09_03840 [Neopusillimonas maritima]